MAVHRKLSLLIVEDDESTRDVLKASLDLMEGVGEVVMTDAVDECLHLAGEVKPDIIIVDSSLSADGDDLGARLRVLRPDATIISFSGTERDTTWATVAILKDGGGVDAVRRAVAAVTVEPTAANQGMRTFVHDMRNPIGALIGFVHLLKTQRENLTQDQFDSIIDGIERSASRLSELLEDFADKR